MVTTISSANICLLVVDTIKRKERRKEDGKFFLLVMRTLGIYSLNNFSMYLQQDWLFTMVCPTCLVLTYNWKSVSFGHLHPFLPHLTLCF